MAWTCNREQSIRAAVPQLLDRATTQPKATPPGSGVVQGVEAGALPAVIRELPVVEFRRGHTIYAEGELGDRLYIIVSGKVISGSASEVLATSWASRAMRSKAGRYLPTYDGPQHHHR